MIRSRSGNGAKALFTVLIVTHSKSSIVHPNASCNCTSSLVIDVSLISRLSVFTVTRNRSRRSISIGCSAIDGTTPVLTFDVGHSSSGMRVSRTYAASRPSCSLPTGPVMSSTMRTPWPSRSAPHHCTASQIDGSPNASPAWIVVWKLARITYWNASRWRVGG